MRAQLTRVELLARKSEENWLPELMALIERVYPEPAYLEQLQSFIFAKSRERVGLSTISSFVQKRFVQPRFTTRRILQILEDLEKKLGDQFTSDQARAVLHAGVTEAVQAGKQVSLEFGLKETRLWDQERRRTRELEVELGKIARERASERERVKEAVEEANDKLGKGESLTAADINRIRERVFGLPAAEVKA